MGTIWPGPVDCGSTNQDVRDNFHCTSSDDLRSQINTIQLFTLFGILAVTFLIVQLVIQIRTRLTKKQILALPTKRLPLDEDDSKATRKLMLTQFAAISDGTINVVPQASSKENGWAALGSKMEQTHFKTSIACSNRILEQAVPPQYARKPHQTVREFLANLKRFPISHEQESQSPYSLQELCTFYLRMYERARYSDHEFTSAQYEDFMWRFYNLVIMFRPAGEGLDAK